MGFTNVAGAFTPLRKAVKALEQLAIEEVAMAAEAAQRTAMSNTSVWSGETVRNYRWGRKGALPSGRIAPVGNYPAPGEQTNKLPLGAEAGRGPNESAALRDMFSTVVMKKLTDFTLTNTIDPSKWDLVDNGAVPTASTSRMAGGVSKLAAQAVRARGHWK